MDSDEFNEIIDNCGFSVPVLARLLNVKERTVFRWRNGTQEIPEGVAEDLLRLEAAVMGAIANGGGNGA